MAYAVSPQPWLQFIDPNGIPYNAGKLYVYQAGSDVLAAIFQDAVGTPHQNPIILDAYGQCALYIDPTKAYKYVLKDRNDVVIRTQDNVFVGASTGIVPLGRVLIPEDQVGSPSPPKF